MQYRVSKINHEDIRFKIKFKKFPAQFTQKLNNNRITVYIAMLFNEVSQKVLLENVSYQKKGLLKSQRVTIWK